MPDFALSAAAACRGLAASGSPFALAQLLAAGAQLLESAQLPFVERYRSYVGVFSHRRMRAVCVSDAAPQRFDALAEAFAAVGGEDTLARMFAADALTQLPDDLLLLTDKMTMATSLECRVPLLDHELVELAARIPAGAEGGRRRDEVADEEGAGRRAAARRCCNGPSAASAHPWAPG